MKNGFRVPKTNYQDYYQEARFSLTWRINLILASTLCILSVVFFYVHQQYLLHYLLGFTITSLGLVYLYITKRFEFIAKVLGITGLLLVSSSVFFIGGSIHIIEPFWMVIITLFAYFTLGKYWGVAFLLYNLVTMVVYFNLFMNANLKDISLLTPGQSMAMSFEFTLCLIIIGHIIHQFILTNRYAESQMKEANQELIQQNELIELQNNEKTVLLKEIHHRVKNNLQVIISLLRIQSGEIQSEEAKQNFSDAINRIMTMSLIHQKMYQKENLSQIDIRDYFTTLTEDLISSGSLGFPIDIKVETSIDEIGSKTIVPLALIITELVTNSMKHAFTDKGSIWIDISSASKDKINLFYRDNGIWKAPNTKSRFGLELLEILTEQLEGYHERNITEEGTQYEFEFSNLDE